MLFSRTGVRVLHRNRAPSRVLRPPSSRDVRLDFTGDWRPAGGVGACKNDETCLIASNIVWTSKSRPARLALLPSLQSQVRHTLAFALR